MNDSLQKMDGLLQTIREVAAKMGGTLDVRKTSAAPAYWEGTILLPQRKLDIRAGLGPYKPYTDTPAKEYGAWAQITDPLVNPPLEVGGIFLFGEAWSLKTTGADTSFTKCNSQAIESLLIGHLSLHRNA